MYIIYIRRLTIGKTYCIACKALVPDWHMFTLEENDPRVCEDCWIELHLVKIQHKEAQTTDENSNDDNQYTDGSDFSPTEGC